MNPPLHNISPMQAIYQISTNPSPTFAHPEKFSDLFHSFLNRCLEKNKDERATVKELLSHKFIKKYSDIGEKDIIKYLGIFLFLFSFIQLLLIKKSKNTVVFQKRYTVQVLTSLLISMTLMVQIYFLIFPSHLKI